MPATQYAFSPFSVGLSARLEDIYEIREPFGNADSGLLVKQPGNKLVRRAVGSMLMAFGLAESADNYDPVWNLLLNGVLGFGLGMVAIMITSVSSGRFSLAALIFGLAVFGACWLLFGLAAFGVSPGFAVLPFIVLVLPAVPLVINKLRGG